MSHRDTYLAREPRQPDDGAVRRDHDSRRGVHKLEPRRVVGDDDNRRAARPIRRPAVKHFPHVGVQVASRYDPDYHQRRVRRGRYGPSSRLRSQRALHTVTP